MLTHHLVLVLDLIANPLLLLALGLPRALSLGEGRARVLIFGATILFAASLPELLVDQITFDAEPKLLRQERTILSIWHVGLVISVVTGVTIWFAASAQIRSLSGLTKLPGPIDASVVAIALVLTAIPCVVIDGGTTPTSRGFFYPFFINEIFSKTILIFGFVWAVLLTSVEASHSVRWPWRTIGIATILAAGPAILPPIYLRSGMIPESLLPMTLYSLPIWAALSLLRAWSRWPWIVALLPTAVAIFAWFWLRVTFIGL